MTHAACACACLRMRCALFFPVDPILFLLLVHYSWLCVSVSGGRMMAGWTRFKCAGRRVCSSTWHRSNILQRTFPHASLLLCSFALYLYLTVPECVGHCARRWRKATVTWRVFSLHAALIRTFESSALHTRTKRDYLKRSPLLMSILDNLPGVCQRVVFLIMFHACDIASSSAVISVRLCLPCIYCYVLLIVCCCSCCCSVAFI